MTATETSVRIESPFPLSEVPRAFMWAEGCASSVMDDSMPQEITAFVYEWEHQPSGVITWAVYRGEEIIGAIVAQLKSGVAEMQVIFAHRSWDQAATVPAIALVVKDLFDYGLDKVAWWPLAHAAQLVNVAKAAGFKREGTLHGHVTQKGKPVDLALFGIWKEESR